MLVRAQKTEFDAEHKINVPLEDKFDYQIAMNFEDFLIALMQKRDADFDEADCREHIKSEFLPLAPGDNIEWDEIDITVLEDGGIELNEKPYDEKHWPGALAKDVESIAASYPMTILPKAEASVNAPSRLRSIADAMGNAFNRVFRPEQYTTLGFVVKGLAIGAGLAAFGVAGFYAYSAGSIALTGLATAGGLAFGYVANRRFNGYAKDYAENVENAGAWEEAAYQRGHDAANTWKGAVVNQVAPSTWMHPTASRAGYLAGYEAKRLARPEPEPKGESVAERTKERRRACRGS